MFLGEIIHIFDSFLKYSAVAAACRTRIRGKSNKVNGRKTERGKRG
nr:MAG TPA: hypothetical protein [Caudoviricetes sp.]